MKRRLFAWLAILLLLTGPALAEASIDISELSLEELFSLRERVDARIDELQNREEAEYAPGSYEVGVDLPEGDYVLVENAGAVFASVTVRNGDAEDSQLLLHKLISGQADIHVTAGTWVVLSEVTARALSQATEAEPEEAGYPSGAYLVGCQLPAGRYIIDIVERAPLSNYSVYDGILGTDAAMIRFEVVREPVELELRDGDYIEMSGCVIRAAE